MDEDEVLVNGYVNDLKLKGIQPKAIEAYSRAIRRIGNYFDSQVDNLTADQLLDYFTRTSGITFLEYCQA